MKSVLLFTVPLTSTNNLLVAIWSDKLATEEMLHQQAPLFLPEDPLQEATEALLLEPLAEAHLLKVDHREAVHAHAALEPPVHLDHQELMETTEMMELQDPMETTEVMPQLDNNQVLLTSASTAHQAPRVQPATQDQRALMVNLARLETMEPQDHLQGQANPVPPEHQDKMEAQEIQAQVGNPDNLLMHLESLDPPAQLVPLDNLEAQAQAVRPETHLLDQLDPPEMLGPMDPQEMLVNPDNPEAMASLAPEAVATTAPHPELPLDTKSTEFICLLNIDNNFVAMLRRNLISLSFMFILFKNKK